MIPYEDKIDVMTPINILFIGGGATSGLGRSGFDSESWEGHPGVQPCCSSRKGAGFAHMKQIPGTSDTGSPKFRMQMLMKGNDEKTCFFTFGFKLYGVKILENIWHLRFCGLW